MKNLINKKTMIRRNSSLFIAKNLLLALPFILPGCSHVEKAKVEQPVRVSVLPVNPGSYDLPNTFSGTVETAETATVSFSVPGTITDVYVKEGQHVRKGQTLARVKSANYVNSGNIADAELAEARDAYARLKKLHDANALPDIKWVEIQNKLKQAENAAEIAHRAVGDATLKAPVDGVVSRKIANVGQTVIAAEPVLEIVTVKDIRINVQVPENEIGKMAEGRRALVSFKNLDIDSIEGKVVSKSVVADPLTRAFAVKIAIPSIDGRILPGMVGEVNISSAVNDTIVSSDVLLPAQSVLLGSDNRNFVWIVKDGKAERRYVNANELSSGGILIQSGLSDGDTVIVAGMEKVGTGTSVVSVISEL